MPGADAVPPLTLAFHGILHSIRIRKRLLRGLTLAVAALIIGAPLAAAFWTERALLLLLLLFPLWFFYLAGDAVLLSLWRRDILRSWRAGQINVAVLRSAVQDLPMIPQATLATMFATLPETEASHDAALPPAERDALSVQSGRRWRRQVASGLLPSLASALIAIGVLLVLSCTRAPAG